MKPASIFLSLSRPIFIFLHYLKVKFRNMKLHWKIQILVLSVMLIGYMLSAVFFHYSTSIYEHQLYSDSATILNLSMQALENEMANILTTASALVTDNIIQEQIRKIESASTEYEEYTSRQSLMNRFYMTLNKKKYILSVTYVDPELQMNSIGSDTSLFLGSNIQELYTISFSENGKPVWVNVDSENPVLILLCPIREVNNLSLRPMGMLAVRINIPRLVKSTLDIKTSAGEDFYIFADKESVSGGNTDSASQDFAPQLFHYGTSDESLGLSLPPFFTDNKPYHINGDGKSERFIVCKRSGYTDWIYCYIIPYDNIFAQFRMLKLQRTVIFLAVYLFLVLITIHFSKSLTKPLKQLARQMDRLSNVDFGTSEISFSDTSRKDEIGLLQKSFRLMIRKIQNLIKEDYVKQLAIRDSEYRTLQAQINPHFMYNTLDSIYWMAINNKQNQIATMIFSLGKLLRESIKYGDDFNKLIPLREELQLLDHYIVIQKIRFQDKIHFQKNIQDNAYDCLLPKLILQPLVENSVNYGVETTAHTCQIIVNAELKEGYLLLCIEDNGIGIENNLLEKLESGKRKPQGSGIGLHNINSRLQIIYNQKNLLSIKNAVPQGTVVTLKIPETADII